MHDRATIIDGLHRRTKNVPKYYCTYMNMYLGAVSKRESQVFTSLKVGRCTAEKIEKTTTMSRNIINVCTLTMNQSDVYTVWLTSRTPGQS